MDDKNNKLPKIDLTPEQIAEILKDVKFEDLMPKQKPEKRIFYHCDICHDTKRVLVCGGPDRDCPACGPRY